MRREQGLGMTPPAFAPFNTANWATVTPFTMSSPSQFRPGPPPALGSPAYTAALSEVQSIGAANSTTRTPDQTVAAEFWASDGPGGVPLTWNNIALQVAATKNNTLLQNAQILAVLGATQVDSFIASYDSKVTYAFWRPVTAIDTTTEAPKADLSKPATDKAAQAPKADKPRHRHASRRAL